MLLLAHETSLPFCVYEFYACEYIVGMLVICMLYMYTNVCDSFSADAVLLGNWECTYTSTCTCTFRYVY